MARKPDVPCGACGKLLWSGRTSLPAGERICQPCRRERRGGGKYRLRTESRCAPCGATFRPWRDSQQFCSRRCAYSVAGRGYWTEGLRDCGGCSAQVVAPRVYCPSCAEVRRQAHWRRKNAVRRGAARVGETLTIAQLGERDSWRCHLCRRRVAKALRSPHPRSATFDHLIPVSAGGTDAPENLRLAHRDCNMRRGAGGSVQLLLVG